MPRIDKPKLATLLTDTSAPLPLRLDLLKQVCIAEDKAADAVLAQILEIAAAGSGEDQYRDKIRELDELLQQMRDGPLRSGTFIRMHNLAALGRRAELVLPEGTVAFCAVPDHKVSEDMRCGDAVWIDAQARAVLFHQPLASVGGEEARLERVLGNGDVEVSVGEGGRFVFRAAALLRDQLEQGEVAPGSTLLVCTRRMLAFQVLPEADGVGHLRFLSRDPIPDVVIERDIGAPPKFLPLFDAHLRREMTNPGVGLRYRMRRSLMHLLTGVPGSGKTFSIRGFWNLMYQVMSEATGVPTEALPQRVMHLKASELLSKWFGESDRNIARFFDEVSEIASQRFEAPDGTVHELPLLVICEEIDSLGRQRGHDGIHDRVLATLLTGLDPSRAVFRDNLVFVIFTTNTPHLVDAALVRRAGGTVEDLGRIDRSSFRAVLTKQLRDLPFRRDGARDSDDARHRAVADLTAWLFAPNSSDGALVEVAFAGRPNPTRKHRRDFLTPALVERAVQQACREACDDEWRGVPDGGLSTEMLCRAIDEQVRNIVNQLTIHNCGQYFALPDAERVATIRRLDSPSVLPLQLLRAS